MEDRILRNRRILIVEDEYMLADDLKTELSDADAIVLGPAGTLEEALDLIRSERKIDGAILDVYLHGAIVVPVADMLLLRDVPFVFTTGYEGSAIPSRYANVIRCEKPINIKRVTQAIRRIIRT